MFKSINDGRINYLEHIGYGKKYMNSKNKAKSDRLLFDYTFVSENLIERTFKTMFVSFKLAMPTRIADKLPTFADHHAIHNSHKTEDTKLNILFGIVNLIFKLPHMLSVNSTFDGLCLGLIAVISSSFIQRFAMSLSNMANGTPFFTLANLFNLIMSYTMFVPIAILYITAFAFVASIPLSIFMYIMTFKKGYSSIVNIIHILPLKIVLTPIALIVIPLFEKRLRSKISEEEPVKLDLLKLFFFGIEFDKKAFIEDNGLHRDPKQRYSPRSTKNLTFTKFDRLFGFIKRHETMAEFDQRLNTAYFYANR